MSRPAGWYWVKCSEEHEWEACEFEEDGWWIEEFSSNKPDGWFPIVGPRIPTPDEPWQCVPKEPSDAMANDGERAFGNPHECNDGDCRVIYKSMLKAAPSPGQEE